MAKFETISIKQKLISLRVYIVSYKKWTPFIVNILIIFCVLNTFYTQSLQGYSKNIRSLHFLTVSYEVSLKHLGGNTWNILFFYTPEVLG